MGYTQAVSFKSLRAYEACDAFLRANFVPWSELEGLQPLPQDRPNLLDLDPEQDWTRYLCRADDLGGTGKWRIGFNFTTSVGFIAEYAFAVLRLCALHWGRRRPIGHLTASPESVPYVVYDGFGVEEVLLRTRWEKEVPRAGLRCLVDEVGFRPFRRPWMGPWVAESVPRSVTFDPATPLTEDVRDYLVSQTALVEHGHVASDDPIIIHGMVLFLERSRIPHDVEYGPIVLDGWRKKAADREDAFYCDVEDVVRAELRRLATLMG